MARLTNEDWLARAKRVPVGQQARHVHGREGRANLVVGNRADRWWAYCQSCKAGAIEMKTHVLLAAKEPEQSRSLQWPSDARIVQELPEYQRDFIARFLASKGMDLTMFNDLGVPLYWSESRHRLLMRLLDGALGRDTSGHSQQKWLTYDGQHYHGMAMPGGPYLRAVFTEDPFSWIKVAWVIQREELHIDPYCTLGTAMHDSLFLHCLQHHTDVASFYDGDGPGLAGAQRNDLRLEAAGIANNNEAAWQIAYRGADPKDMPYAEILAHLKRLYSQSPGG